MSQSVRAHLRLVNDATESPAVVSDPLSLEQAFRDYSSYVGAVAIRVLGRRDDIDDLVQDVFVRAQRGLRTLRDPGAVKGWLATVTVRLARRRLRARRLLSFFHIEPEVHEAAWMHPALSPHDAMLLKEVYRVLDRLPVKQRLAWSLRHLEGERLGRVAELCGCSLATAKRRITAAQSHIKNALEDGDSR